MKRRVIVVQHTEHEHAGLIGHALAQLEIATEFVRLDLGEPLPNPAEAIGVLSLGGPMSVNDEEEHPWIVEECEFLRAVIKAGSSVVGVCLGAQLIAKALGSEVKRNKKWEIGWHPVELSAVGITDDLLSAEGASPTVYHWHGETFDLPENAELLASSGGCENQAFRIFENGMRVYGFQFHPEIDSALVGEWLDHEDCLAEIKKAQAHSADFVQSPDEQRLAHQGESSATFSKLIAQFLTDGLMPGTRKEPKSKPRQRPKR